jgi:hypothetical protein
MWRPTASPKRRPPHTLHTILKHGSASLRKPAAPKRLRLKKAYRRLLAWVRGTHIDPQAVARAIMWLLGRIFPGIIGSNLLGANILKLSAIIGTMSISFFGMRLWVFLQRRFAEEARSLADYETERLPALKLFYDPDTSVTYALGQSRPGDKAAQNHACASRTQKHWQVEEPISFSLVETPPSSSDAPILPITPLPALKSGHSPARNLRSVKLRPLRETESALES